MKDYGETYVSLQADLKAWWGLMVNHKDVAAAAVYAERVLQGATDLAAYTKAQMPDEKPFEVTFVCEEKLYKTVTKTFLAANQRDAERQGEEWLSYNAANPEAWAEASLSTDVAEYDIVGVNRTDP